MKIHNLTKLSLSIAAVFTVSACNTLPTIENAWRTQSYIHDDTVDVENVENTLEAILSNGLPNKSESLERGAFFAMNIDKSANYKDVRNAAQDYLKAVSNQNCNRFKTQALAAQSNTNFALGGVATTLGTVGSLLSPASTAQALSGASAAVNGIQAQVGQNYYREKTFEIITRAINVKRQALWANIENKRKTDNVNYTVNHALADMIEYNNACSVIVGFEELTDSVASKETQVENATREQKRSGKEITVEELIAK